MFDYEVVGEGLLLPEGPVALPDGSVLVVEGGRGTLTRVWGEGRSEVVADLGGGPNGAAIGPDGAVYVVNNGGYDWTLSEAGTIEVELVTPAAYTGGWVDRVDLDTGRHERIYERCGEHPLKGPNDIVFDRAGNFWFTDMGRIHARHRDAAGLYYASPDGRSIREVDHGRLSFNGIGLSPDQARLYVADTFNARLWAYDVEAPGEVRQGTSLVGGLADASIFDSLAVTESGGICVATIGRGGIARFGPEGTCEHHAAPDEMVTNICFGGADMRDAYLTLAKSGRLIQMRWPEPGPKLNFNPY